MDVNKLLDELEELVEHRPLPLVGRARPFRKAFFLDVDDVLDSINQIRVSLPQQIQRADQITREKDRILAEAREQADRMVTEAAEQAELQIRKAQDDARLLVSTHEITRQAQQEGQRLVDVARQEATEIRQGALEYARTVLDNLTGTIDNLVGHVAQVQRVAQQARDEVKS
jgi:vacuolar-type H+-ATPase subunit H